MCQHCNYMELKGYSGRIDESSYILNKLLDEGFTNVRWVNTETACDICRQLDGREWSLQDFINDTMYEAPIFSKSHPNCLCYLVVSNDQGVEINVNYAGEL